MDNDNKNRIVTGLEVLGLVAWALLVIATACGVWNFCPEKAVKFAATIVFTWNIGLVAWLGYKLYKKNKSHPQQQTKEK